MNPPPGTGVCQGNFAASVKEILPIYECGILAISASTCGIFPDNYRELAAHSSLTGRALSA